MVASVVVILIVALSLILCLLTLRNYEQIAINNQLFLLVGVLVGMILAALVVTLILYFYNKNKDAAIRKQGCKLPTPIGDNHSPIENSINAMEFKACAVPTHSPRLGTKESENIHTDINSEYVHQHVKTRKHSTQLKILPGTTLNTIQENPATQTIAAYDQLDNLTLEDSEGTRTLLESSC